MEMILYIEGVNAEDLQGYVLKGDFHCPIKKQLSRSITTSSATVALLSTVHVM